MQNGDSLSQRDGLEGTIGPFTGNSKSVLSTSKSGKLTEAGGKDTALAVWGVKGGYRDICN